MISLVGTEAALLNRVLDARCQRPRHRASMTMVRGGEERDLAAIVAMGRARAEPFRFHLDRDVDFVQ